jgi:membrane associated rhomboid family serine protease
VNWFSKFVHLLYIAYLDCENTLRTFAFIIIGVVIGLLSVVFSVAYLPPDYTFLSMILVSITMWNLGIYLILGFQYIVSIIIVWSMLKVAYIYDNQSWEYVHSLTNAGNAIGTQLDTDKLTKKELDKKHTEMLNEKIGKLKDN